jgi:hypothetical protein
MIIIMMISGIKWLQPQAHLQLPSNCGAAAAAIPCMVNQSSNAFTCVVAL